MAELYKIFNGPAPTTASQAAVTTGTNIKTMMQLKFGAAIAKPKIVAWGISFDGSAAATPGIVELCETGTVFATVTAYAAADIQKYGDPNAPDPTTSILSVGTSASGYTSSGEGTITTVRQFDCHLLPPTGPFAWEFSLGREPLCGLGTSIRIRVKFAAAINAICWMLIEA